MQVGIAPAGNARPILQGGLAGKLCGPKIGDCALAGRRQDFAPAAESAGLLGRSTLCNYIPS